MRCSLLFYLYYLGFSLCTWFNLSLLLQSVLVEANFFSIPFRRSNKPNADKVEIEALRNEIQVLLSEKDNLLSTISSLNLELHRFKQQVLAMKTSRYSWIKEKSAMQRLYEEKISALELELTNLRKEIIEEMTSQMEEEKIQQKKAFLKQFANEKEALQEELETAWQEERDALKKELSHKSMSLSDSQRAIEELKQQVRDEHARQTSEKVESLKKEKSYNKSIEKLKQEIAELSNANNRQTGPGTEKKVEMNEEDGEEVEEKEGKVEEAVKPQRSGKKKSNRRGNRISNKSKALSSSVRSSSQNATSGSSNRARSRTKN